MRIDASLPVILGLLVGLQGLGGTLQSAGWLLAGALLTVGVQATATRLAGAREIRLHGLGAHASGAEGPAAYLVPLSAPVASAALGLLVLAPSLEARIVGAVALAGAALHLLPAWPLGMGEVLWVALRRRVRSPRRITRRSGLLVGGGLCLIGLTSGAVFVAVVGAVLLVANRPQRKRTTALLPGAPA